MKKLPALREDSPLTNVTVRDRTPFFSFRYSYTEVRAVGTTARVKAREVRLEDGVVESHSFEGTCDRSVYDGFVQQMQRQLFAQAALFLKAFSWFLPYDKSHRE
jgi:hypothetical protein